MFQLCFRGFLTPFKIVPAPPKVLFNDLARLMTMKLQCAQTEFANIGQSAEQFLTPLLVNKMETQDGRKNETIAQDGDAADDD